MMYLVVCIVSGIPRSLSSLGMTHTHMSLRVPQGRSNLLNQKIASSHWRAPRNDIGGECHSECHRREETLRRNELICFLLGFLS